MLYDLLYFSWDRGFSQIGPDKDKDLNHRYMGTKEWLQERPIKILGLQSQNRT